MKFSAIFEEIDGVVHPAIGVGAAREAGKTSALGIYHCHLLVTRLRYFLLMTNGRERSSTGKVHNFLEALRIQRWDDHRFYHHSRINQSLHFLSSISFLSAYALIFKNPAASALLGWLVAMVSRQAGHFFFEPKSYDEVNQATHEHKEDIKVGYNLRRKVVLMFVWALSPALLWVSPTLFGIFSAQGDHATFVQHVGQIWLVVGFGALLFRTVQLFFIRDVQTGLVWMTKILTDPFHDFMLYYRAPFYLMHGQLIDPMHDVTEAEAAEALLPAHE